MSQSGGVRDPEKVTPGPDVDGWPRCEECRCRTDAYRWHVEYDALLGRYRALSVFLLRLAWKRFERRAQHERRHARRNSRAAKGDADRVAPVDEVTRDSVMGRWRGGGADVCSDDWDDGNERQEFDDDGV